MSLTSFSFLVFLALLTAVYSLAGKKYRWTVLLAFSIAFFLYEASPLLLALPLLSSLSAYGASLAGARQRSRGKRGTVTVGAAIAFNILLWFIFKGGGYWKPLIPALSAVSLPAALGMSYYVMQVIAYLLDCHWESIQPERNFLKLFLFVIFFPQMTSGPISRREDMASLYDGARPTYGSITQGAQRIVWGFFKKLVISVRIAAVVDMVYADPGSMGSRWMLLAVVLYPLQLYTDFSGCMDIVLGAAELTGITLRENFNSPFFSRTVQEFWKRWHITLGSWAQTYVLYPVLMSPAAVRLGKWSRKHFSRRIGTLIPTEAGMFASWMVMGIWHGSYKYWIGSGIWYWVVMLLSELAKPLFKKLNALLHIPEKSLPFHVFQSLRTYGIFCLSLVFFRSADIPQALSVYGLLLGAVTGTAGAPAVSLALIHGKKLLLVSLAVLFAASLLREKYGSARVWLAKRPLPLRWTVYLALLFAVLLEGQYGPGFEAADFIYQGF